MQEVATLVVILKVQRLFVTHIYNQDCGPLSYKTVYSSISTFCSKQKLASSGKNYFLKMEAASSSKTLVTTYKTRPYHN